MNVVMILLSKIDELYFYEKDNGNRGRYILFMNKIKDFSETILDRVPKCYWNISVLELAERFNKEAMLNVLKQKLEIDL